MYGWGYEHKITGKIYEDLLSKTELKAKPSFQSAAIVTKKYLSQCQRVEEGINLGDFFL